MASAVVAPTPHTDEQKLIKIQSLLRGRQSRLGAQSAQVAAQSALRRSALASGTVLPSPFLPTPHEVVSEILSLANVGPGDCVVDVGCGDGRVVIAAAARGARAVGIESDASVYARAASALSSAPGEIQSLVQLIHADFASLPVPGVVCDALDRATHVFLFLLPGDSSRVVSLAGEAVGRRRRKWVASGCASRERGGEAEHASPSSSHPPAAAAAAATAAVAAHSPSPSSLAAVPAPSTCPCLPSLRLELLSWTFSLSAAPCSTLALPLEVSSVHKIKGDSALQVVKLCACMVYACEAHGRAGDGGEGEGEGHAAVVAREFAQAPCPSSSAASAASAASASVAPPSLGGDVSSIPWGHALNSVDSLLARLESPPSSDAQHQGCFIECDLRLGVGVGAEDQGQEVVLAHDVATPGAPRLADWYASLRTWGAHNPSTPLGLKLDFKQLEAVRPTLEFLAAERAEGRTVPGTKGAASNGLLWLNADVLRGPGCPALSAPMDARAFLDVVRRFAPSDAVLSLGWVTSSDSGGYTHAHVTEMLDLLADAGASCHQVTFPLRASLVRESWRAGSLQRLLSACPRHSLTIWTSHADQAQPHAADDEAWIRSTLPKDRTFLDLKL